MIAPEQWLGLCLRSESEQPHEWPAIAWVVRNRVEARFFGTTYQEVVLAPMQFSYFNQFSGLDPDAVFDAARQGYAGDAAGENSFGEAVRCAIAVTLSSRWQAPFGPRVFHFWSPISMMPRGSDPAWAQELRVFTLPGIDPARFKFGERRP